MQDQSRLSARYFLAASTPFKPSDSVNSTTASNWMNQSSFHITSSQLNDNSDERTLVGNDFTLQSPNKLSLR